MSMTNAELGFLDRFGRMRLITAVVVVIAVVVALVLVVTLKGKSEYRITAEFTATPGLYTHNAVDVLGVPEGRIVSVTPEQSSVKVVMAIPSDVKLPANVKAVMMAPNPVSDRFLELTPPYTGGPTLAPGATLGLSSTVVPLELDQVYSNVDSLAKMLGPAGANKDGQLSAVLHAFAGLANGNGGNIHSAIDQIAAALPSLTNHPHELARLVDGIDRLSTSLAAHDSTINSLYDDLATTTTQLSDQRQTIAAAVANLQGGLAQVAQFISANQASLGGAVKHLNTTIAAVMSRQSALIKTFDTAPLGFQNFNRAIDPTTACPNATGTPNNCPAIWTRVDLTSNAFSVIKTYCGDNFLDAFSRVLTYNAQLGPERAVDTLCASEFAAIQKRKLSPGAPLSPSLDLSRYLGSQ